MVEMMEKVPWKFQVNFYAMGSAMYTKKIQRRHVETNKNVIFSGALLEASLKKLLHLPPPPQHRI